MESDIPQYSVHVEAHQFHSSLATLKFLQCKTCFEVVPGLLCWNSRDSRQMNKEISVFSGQDNPT